MDKGIAALLGLQSWILYRVRVEQDRIDVYAGRPREEARCPRCGSLTRSVSDRSRKWQRKLHTWCHGVPVFLWVRSRRFRCGGCREVFTERLPGIRPWARRTERTEDRLLKAVAQRSFRGAAEATGTRPNTLRRLLMRRVRDRVDLERVLQDLAEVVLGSTNTVFGDGT